MTATTQKMDAAGAAEGSGVGSMIKDAIAAAVLAFALCFPIIMLHAESDNDGNLFLTWRPWAVLVICAIAFAGRLALALYAARPVADPPVAVAAAPAASSAFIAQYIAIFGLAVIVVFTLAVW